MLKQESEMKEIIEVYKNPKGQYVVYSELFFDGVKTDDYVHIFDSIEQVIEFKSYYSPVCWWAIKWVSKLSEIMLILS